MSTALDTARAAAAADGRATLDRTSVFFKSAKRVERWVEEHDYQAYEPFDCLSSPFKRLTGGSLLFERLLQQVGRQSPVNVRPLLLVKPLPSTKGRGYMAAGYLTLFELTGEVEYRVKARTCLDWLIENRSPKFTEYSWANHFDYASRGGRYSKHESIIVWSALIGQAFLDGYEVLGDHRYLEVAESVCRWILALPRERTDTGDCLSYHMLHQNSVHNANMLGAAFLARTWKHVGRSDYLEVAAAAMLYSCSRQLSDGAWWYGEDPKYRWIDNFHTGYNLDSLLCYTEATGDAGYRTAMLAGFDYYKRHFFDGDGRPRYYHNRAYPIDSQCASQSIETLARFSHLDKDSLELGQRVAEWTITNMQARDGHFFYRLYPVVKAKMPMLHWAQATMYHALSLLVQKEAWRRSDRSAPSSAIPLSR